MSFSFPFEFHKGDRLDGVTVVKPVARGGNGDLYLVRDDDERPLALKVVRKTDNDGERNGIEQCRAVSSHIPGLLPVLKSGLLPDGRSYCVMPLADNLVPWPDYEPDTLANRIRRDGRIRTEEVLQILPEILKTVGELHEAGLFHCDIKPENILFLDGKPMLSDYSLLSDTAETPAGTIGFVPPEMLQNPGRYSPMACDLYAIGKILYCAWSGKDVAFFPSVPREIALQEIGLIRPLYMKACNVTPARRFQNAGEFFSAVEKTRSRLEHALSTRVQSSFRKHLPVLLFALLLLLCVIGLVNILFLLKIQSGKTKQEPEANAAPPPGETGQFFFSAIPDDNMVNRGNADPPDPLVITTDSDVVDANDGENSLREALDYAMINGAGATLSFTRDCEIRLSAPLSVTQNVIIDGGENRITLIGPKTAPMFQVNESKLTLKNLSLISDRADGGILDARMPGSMDLFSVKDGGKAERLWVVSDRFDIKLNGESRLHRVRVNPGSKGADIVIGAGSVLEDLDFTGDSRNISAGNCDVFGLLKNVSVADVGDIYVNSGGTAENITVKKNGFLDLRPGGKIDGVKVEFGGVMGYMTDGIVTGTISIGGVAWEPNATEGYSFGTFDGARAFPVIDERKTDIVFDLTERTDDSRSWFNVNVEVRFTAIRNIVEGPEATRLLFNDLASFLGAHSYTVRVRDDQEPGTYLLGTQADKFDSAVSLAVGDTVYPDALVVGKKLFIGDTCYTLSLDIWESRNGSFLTNRDVRNLMLTIEKQ